MLQNKSKNYLIVLALITAFNIIVLYARNAFVGDTTYSSNWVAGNGLSWDLPPILRNGGSYTVSVMVQDNVGLQGTSSVNFTAAWTPPAAPTFTVTP